MRKVLSSAVFVTAIVGIIGCNSQKKANSYEEVTQNHTVCQKMKDSSSPFGTFKGTFPCADCGGKVMNLTINEDGTYCLKYQYLDKDERLVEENGTYSIFDETLVVTVTPSSGEKTYYKYVQGNLVLSDSLGIVDDGELAELYVLKRN